MVFVSALSHFLEFFILLFFLNDLFSCTGKRMFRMFAVGFGMHFAAFLSFVIFDSTLVNISLCFIIDFVFAKLYFDCGIKGALLSSLFLAVSNTATEFLVINFLAMISSGDITSYQSNVYMYLMMVLMSKAALFVLVKAAAYMGLYLRDGQVRAPLFLLIYPVASIVILYTFWMISIRYELTQGISLIISASGIAVIISVFLTFIFYGRTSRRMDDLFKAQSEAERLQADQTYYALLDKQNELLKTMTHDEKNHLIAIKALANDPAVDEYIENIYGEIKCHSMFGNTKNRYLDLMFNKYNSICDSEGIDFSFSAVTANLSFMEAPDMITFVSNVLDNAVDAAKKSKKKRIELSVSKRNGAEVFSCCNSCEYKPRTDGKILKTTKNSDGFHGLGVKSVKNIVGKYGGEFDWAYDDSKKEFRATAVFFCKSGEQCNEESNS